MNAHAHPASAGRLWWRQSLKLLQQQPLALVALVFFYFLLLLLFTLVPVIGSWVMLLLVPGLAAGFAYACQKAAQSKRVTPYVFFEAFFSQPQGQLPVTKPLLTLGVFYAAGFLIACSFSALFDDGKLFSIVVLDQAISAEALKQLDLRAAQFAMACIFLPMQILFLFSPLLVAWHQTSPVKALFFSAIAVKRNLGALTILGLYLFATSFFGMLLLSILQSIVGSSVIGTAVQGLAFAMICAILVAWINCANYISYVHIFRARSTTPATPVTSNIPTTLSNTE